MSVSVGRNDPCPCGSGLKYKQCCQGKLMSNLRGRRGLLFAAIGVAVVALVVFGVWRSRTDPTASRSPGSGPPGSAAQPWAYDSVSNRHYDPGHGHWHDGPPPTLEARGGGLTPPASPAPAAGVAAPFGASPTPGAAPPGPGATPAPWTYDEKNNQHWDPVHGHWHPGPPPAGAR